MADRLAGKRVIVTGGMSGIGAAITERFTAEGAAVVVVDIAVSPAEQGDTGAPVRLHADVTQAADSEAVFDVAVARLGGLDCLVTAAGATSGKSLKDCDDQEWDRIMALNLRGTFVWLRAAARYLSAHGGGSVITIGSQLVYAGARNNAAYVASKGAIHALTRTAALELAPVNVRVNCLVPGATDTPLLRNAHARQPDPQAARATAQARHALGRFATAAEIASGALYLASDEAAFTTGAELVIDGGWSVA